MTTQELIPGLAGIPAAESAISYIDGTAGILTYRGFPIEVLSEHSNFEETAWLLLYGSLPTRSQLDTFRSDLDARRALPDSMVDLLRALPRKGHPMRALQAGLAALGMANDQVEQKNEASQREAVLRILAATPTIIATFQRFRQGQDYLAPEPGLSTAAAFLGMLNGERPSTIAERILDCCLLLHAEHTMNASTFAARVVASTEAGPYTVCSSAVGALYGSLHGGANERVLQQLEEIGGKEDVQPWFAARMAARDKVMGLGHRVYKTKDPRAITLQGLVRQLFAEHGSTPMYDTALALEQEVLKHLGAKGIHPNVDFFSGIVYQKLGIPTDVFTPIFAMARTAGWLAHWSEQMQDNRIFRPGQVYVGVHSAEWVPIDERG
ncbi:MAG: citrate synthase [Planctomycetota bacterium]